MLIAPAFIFCLLAATAVAQTPPTAEEYMDSYTGEARIASTWFGHRYYLGSRRVDASRFDKALSRGGDAVSRYVAAGRRRLRRGCWMEALGTASSITGLLMLRASVGQGTTHPTRNPNELGVVLLVGGAALDIAGTVFHISGRSALRRGVRLYNAGRGGRLGFFVGPTGQGFGLALRW